MLDEKGLHRVITALRRARMQEWPRLAEIRSYLSQNLRVDGYRPTTDSGRISPDNSSIWERAWQPNRMDGRQSTIHWSAAKQQIGRLAEFIMDEIEGEPSQPEGAVDTAIRLLRSSHQASTEKDTP